MAKMAKMAKRRQKPSRDEEDTTLRRKHQSSSNSAHNDRVEQPTGTQHQHDRIAASQAIAPAARIWSHRVSKEPKGIVWRRNHCYRNASFAVFMHMPELLSKLEEHDVANCEQMLCLVCKFLSVVEVYWDSKSHALREDQAGPLKDLTSFIDTFNESQSNLLKRRTGSSRLGFLPTRNLIFERGPEGSSSLHAQQDAADFSDWIYQKLCCDTKATCHFGDISELFRSETQVSWRCGSCGHERSYAPEANQAVISIPSCEDREQKECLSRALNFYLDHQWFNQSVGTLCEGEGCLSEKSAGIKDPTAESMGEKQYRLQSTSEYLMFFIQRTKYDMVEYKAFLKDSNVNLPLWLDLNRYKHSSFEGGPEKLRYKLWSTIYYEGEDLQSGHYHGVYVGPKGPRRINDGSVQAANASHLVNVSTKSRPYLVTYKRFGQGKVV